MQAKKPLQIRISFIALSTISYMRNQNFFLIPTFGYMIFCVTFFLLLPSGFALRLKNIQN